VTIVVVLVIGLAWIAFLGPTIMRARDRQGRSDSVGDFRHRLTQLGRTNGRHGERRHDMPMTSSLQRPLYAPLGARRPMSALQRRRRDVLLGIAAAALVTLLVALVTRSIPFILLNLLADAALVGYVYLLVQHKQRATERRTKVRFLGSAYREAVPYSLDAPDRFGTSESSGPRLVPLRQASR
jgi:hypothetical protein